MSVVGSRGIALAVLTVAVGAALGSCDPVAAVTVTSALRTAPATDCPARALARSSLIDSIRPAAAYPRGDSGSVMARLRNGNVVEVIDQWVFVGVRKVRDSTNLVVMFRLPGRPTWAVDDEDSRRLAQVGQALADDVVTICTPAAATRVSCRVSGMFWTKACGRG